jgi:hypothetical protein
MKKWKHKLVERQVLRLNVTRMPILTLVGAAEVYVVEDCLTDTQHIFNGGL